MNKTIASLSLAAAAVALSSCSTISDFAPCLSKSGPAQQECVTGVLLDKAIAYLAESSTVNNTESADNFASTWSSLQSLVGTAQSFGVEIPASVKKPYNSTLIRMASKNYYGSTKLRSVMSTGKLL